MGFQKLGLDHIGLLDGTGGGSLSGVEGGRRQGKLPGTLADTFLQEFTQLEEGDHGDKTSHAASEVIAVMGHVSQSNRGNI